MRSICVSIAVAFLPLCACADELTAQVAKGHETQLRPALAGVGIQFVYEDQKLSAGERSDVTQLKIPLLRIPAGTQAMAYDWETGSFHGAGVHEGKRKVATTQLADYFDVANQVSADVSYVVNVYQDTPEKTRRLAETVKSKGY